MFNAFSRMLEFTILLSSISNILSIFFTKKNQIFGEERSIVWLNSAGMSNFCSLRLGILMFSLYRMLSERETRQVSPVFSTKSILLVKKAINTAFIFIIQFHKLMAKFRIIRFHKNYIKYVSMSFSKSEKINGITHILHFPCHFLLQ